MEDKMIRELLKGGYTIFGKKITRMTKGVRERYLVNLPEPDNEIWKLLREKRITLYIEVPKEEMERIKQKSIDMSVLAMQALEKGMIRIGNRKISIMSRTGRERYAIYLSEGYKDLWRILYENNAKVNIFIVISEDMEKESE